MKTLFDINSYNEILNRIEKLTPETQAKWGKMNVGQMLSHCSAAFKNAMLKESQPRMLIGILIGWAFKKQLYNDKAYKPGSPTAPDFIRLDSRDFIKEKATLLNILKQFHEGGEAGVTKFPHPFFGKFTPEQWGRSQYKHIDHHLRQFGA